MLFKKKIKICVIYEDGTIAENNVFKWFARFRNVNFDLVDQKYSSKPVVVDDQIKICHYHMTMQIK